MNNNQSISTIQQDRSTGSLQQLKSLVRNNLVGTITATVAGSLLLTGASTWNIWSIYNGFESIVVKDIELQNISKDLLYQDEVLTMSARMLASTGDLQWETRYKNMVPQSEATLKKFLTSISTELRTEAAKTNTSADKLFALENQAFKLVKQNKQKEGYAILQGAEYATQKKIYADGSNLVMTKVNKLIQTELSNYQQQLITSIIFAGATLPILLASWTLVLSAVRDYIRDRQSAQAEIEQSQQDLLKLNQKLAGEVDIRSQQEAQIRSESELLQTDIAHILDVVCALEEGDLTVSAQVNERATGLVSDTLNRLIESLDRIVSTVVDTAMQVTTDAEKLELTALETAQQAQSQANEVRSVQALMDNINTLTADSRQQAIDTSTAVLQAKSAVVSGKQAISDTTDGIATLQQSSKQIVKRSELLTEFVDLAAQFSKERKKVAALTRVLALNVSTLASRAMRERDPEQFASLAKEFETIAIQVNNLATDNDLSLSSLQQRTDRVQTVTSGLTQDISEIDVLVQKLTTEVNKSSAAFDNIQNVTERVAQMSQQVNSSSIDIVRVVTDTLSAIESISTVAQSTEIQAAISREQVQSMSKIVTKLLQMVEFFKLNESALSQSPAPQQLSPTAQAPSQLARV